MCMTARSRCSPKHAAAAACSVLNGSQVINDCAHGGSVHHEIRHLGVPLEKSATLHHARQVVEAIALADSPEWRRSRHVTDIASIDRMTCSAILANQSDCVARLMLSSQ